MVTKRLQPLQVDGKQHWQIGFPLHWGYDAHAGPHRPAGQLPDAVGHGPEHVDARVQDLPRQAREGLRGGAAMSMQALDIRRSSASVWGSHSGLRSDAHGVEVHRHHDLHRLQGLRGRLPGVERPEVGRRREQTGTYQTLPTLHPDYWNLIRFNERDFDGGIVWLMRKDQCMHCDEPGCLAACPAPGAIVQYGNGIVDVNPDQCIGCKYCETGCPFDVPEVLGDHREDVQVHALRRPRRRSDSSPRASSPAPPAASTSARRTTWSRSGTSASASSRPTGSRRPRSTTRRASTAPAS